ncbi:hypothetical protein [Halomonas sp. I5-271120]|uniref:hypothetical protein n=1 Tax=Halomonas sp. I5-271120 TaxID=3061632 RepID=UPI002714912C|nr:hypothetical protein [Halomonas sp. I5-271120]
MINRIINAIRTSRDARRVRRLRRLMGLSESCSFATPAEPTPQPIEGFLEIGKGMEVRTVDVDPAEFGLSAKGEREVHLGDRDEISMTDLERALSQVG